MTQEGKGFGGVSNNWDWVRNNMSARASCVGVSNWSTTKFKASTYLVETECRVPLWHYYSVSPRSARHPPSGGVSTCKRYRFLLWRSAGCKNQRGR